MGRSVKSQGMNKVASPMALLKCSMRTSVFFTSEEYTSEPTIGQKGTFLPSSCAIPRASAVFPVPGAPVTRKMYNQMHIIPSDSRIRALLTWLLLHAECCCCPPLVKRVDVLCEGLASRLRSEFCPKNEHVHPCKSWTCTC